LATSFISLNAGEVDSAIRRSLGILGEFAGAQRSYICLVSEDGARLRHTHQWCVTGVEPLESGAAGFSAEAFPWWVQKLKNLEDVHITDLADLPPEAQREREFLQTNKVRSTLMVPLRYGPSLTGVLGFDSLQRQLVWSEELIALLKIAGVVFGNAIERKRSEEERGRLIEQLQESLAKVRTLSGLLPICANCKKIRDDKGYWNQIETYIRDRSEAEFTHGICPECAQLLYPQDYTPK
jgi:GAF domain-containing protein